MNQSRIFLLIAWLMVAMLLWMEWGKEQQAAREPAKPVPAQMTVPDMVPGQAPAIPGVAPVATPAASAATGATPGSARAPVVVSTDVLRLTLDGGGVRQAELLKYPQSRASGSAPVRLFDAEAARFYAAQSGWVGQNGSPAPSHQSGFVPVAPEKTYALSDGQASIEVPFIWRGADGVTIQRTYALKRGDYAVEVRDEVVNVGGKPWNGYVYRQLVRVPPTIEASMFHPESYSFNGATWWSKAGGYQRRAFKDYLDDGQLNQTIGGGWLAMLQHHFFTAWIPQADQPALYALDQRGPLASIAATGPQFNLAPGQKAETRARLWVGPKLVDRINAAHVPGLDRAVDYSRFSIFAVLGQGLFWVLSKLHELIGNWGWAIIGLVVLLKIALFPLSNAQYKSAAKMRKFQPRLQQLKERYGDDKQKFQQAMMELYKTEKINPMGGCLPIIPQILIFMTLYWVLSEAVELRHAPWIGWIQDLTARDPYFILPVLNAAIMIATQHLTPMAPGMDPMQQKMMKLMPVIFGVLLAFLPAGLVLYQVANGGLGLIQQWYMLKKYGDAPAKAK
ncbi:membrane protein insertase YidC [Lysobacter pythonis]|uniref:Membrane protein insertase YidC n=1 Tax=Solilutibacter pythonis TaxID=2483112 RepID=A0A3M2I2M6_9GAMM|nr:membrane protein insertase YidC [Lysobacter pythonis]RMH93849.1 membrane protein insertase YidC [Lysobacter pythonis]